MHKLVIVRRYLRLAGSRQLLVSSDLLAQKGMKFVPVFAAIIMWLPCMACAWGLQVTACCGC
jgi:hypothetical protein